MKPHTGQPQDTQADRPVRACITCEKGEARVSGRWCFECIKKAAAQVHEDFPHLKGYTAPWLTETASAENPRGSTQQPAESTPRALSPSPALPSSPKPRGTPT